jgi:hypothetical protein
MRLLIWGRDSCNIIHEVPLFKLNFNDLKWFLWLFSWNHQSKNEGGIWLHITNERMNEMIKRRFTYGVYATDAIFFFLCECVFYLNIIFFVDGRWEREKDNLWAAFNTIYLIFITIWDRKLFKILHQEVDLASSQLPLE